MRKIFVFIPALLMLMSCQTDLDIPFPVHEPRLTLNGYLVEGGPLFLYVTRSYGALEDIDINSDTSVLVRDAQVEVWRNGENMGQLEFVPSGIDTIVFQAPGINDTLFTFAKRNLYLLEDSAVVPQIGDEFEFRASHPIYGEASVKAEVMPKPEILGLELTRDSLIISDFDGYQTRWSVFKIRLRDPGQVSNYYVFKGTLDVIGTFDDGSGQMVQQQYDYPINISTEVTRDEEGFIYGSEAPLSDREFNGEETTVLGWVSLPGCCGYPGDIEREEVELVRLKMDALLVDEAFGDYQQKRVLQSNSRTEGIEGAILPREPVSVVGNVEGGYGMLGSFNFAYFSFEL